MLNNPSRIVAQLPPYLVSFIGVSADLLTTLIGLSLGYYEAHPNYHPVLALAIFWAAIIILEAFSPRNRLWRVVTIAVASLTFLGAFNNALVILGVFPVLSF